MFSGLVRWFMLRNAAWSDMLKLFGNDFKWKRTGLAGFFRIFQWGWILNNPVCFPQEVRDVH
jgi:hypothetical protein